MPCAEGKASPEKRRDDAQARIQKKLEVLKKLATTDLLKTAVLPRSINEVASWVDESLGVTSVSRGAIYKAHNAGLKSDIEKVLIEIARKKAGSAKRKCLSVVERERNELKAERDSLVNQITDIEAELTNAMSENRRLKAEKAVLERDNADLTRQLEASRRVTYLEISRNDMGT